MAPKLIFVEFLYIGVQIVRYEFDNKTARTADFLFFIYCHTPYLVLKREHKVGIITVWVRVVVPKAAISLSFSLPPSHPIAVINKVLRTAHPVTLVQIAWRIS